MADRRAGDSSDLDEVVHYVVRSQGQPASFHPTARLQLSQVRQDEKRRQEPKPARKDECEDSTRNPGLQVSRRRPVLDSCHRRFGFG